MAVVLQSVAADAPAWVGRCLGSVRRWAARAGHDHEVIGDELLALAPDWVRARADGPLPVTDVARLVLLADRLRGGAGHVIWLDADVLVVEAAALHLEAPAGLALGDERWVTGSPGGGLQVVRMVHNAVIVGTSLDAVADLLDRTLSHAQALDRITARALGPDLLTVLHRSSPFTLTDEVSMLSPRVVAELAAGGGPAWDLQRTSGPVVAANLCGSMATDDRVVERAIDELLELRVDAVGDAAP